MGCGARAMTKMPPDETDAEQRHRLWWGVRRRSCAVAFLLYRAGDGHRAFLAGDPLFHARRLLNVDAFCLILYRFGAPN